MSEIGDLYKAMKQDRQRKGDKNRSVSTRLFQEAYDLACLNGLFLIQHSGVHYSLRHPVAKWRLEIYPGNQRIYSPPDERGPLLNLRQPWTILDAVRRAAKIGSP